MMTACVDKSFDLADVSTEVTVGQGTTTQMGISVEDIRKELASRHIIDHKVKQEKMTQ